MRIVRKNRNISRYYGDISIGEVFSVIAYDDVYMRTECGALCLEDGCYYNVEDDDEVELLDVELHVL